MKEIDYTVKDSKENILVENTVEIDNEKRLDIYKEKLIEEKE